jgi:hypothetical protein
MRLTEADRAIPEWENIQEAGLLAGPIEEDERASR